AWVDLRSVSEAPPLTLARGATVAGVVQDERGLALAGARVVLSVPSLSTRAASAGDETRSVLSGDDGRFEVAGIAGSASRVVVTVRARGFLPLRRVVDLGSSAKLVLALARAEGEVSGLVVDERGLPLADATVSARIGGVAVSASSSSAGRFTLEGVGRRGVLVVEARKDGFAAFRKQVRAGERAVMMRLERLQSLHLVLVDHRTGAAVTRARVAIDGAAARHVTATTAQGALLLRAARGQHRLTIQAPGYARTVARVRVDDGPLPTRERIELKAAGSVSGIVTDSNGQPLAGARVSAGGVSTRSANDGTFTLGGIAEGHHALVVERGSAHHTAGVSVLAGQTTGPLRVQLGN
ncbi:MAG: carboxypeptidase regulatory-like domain-containing protein, partial [Myxococcales bacterium]|nr:carboxypeptidase regulatory-like domain-containing protein [Myxococcales bacterium]